MLDDQPPDRGGAAGHDPLRPPRRAGLHPDLPGQVLHQEAGRAPRGSRGGQGRSRGGARRCQGSGRRVQAGGERKEMIKTKDLHAMTMPDLLKQLKSSRQELFNLRFQMATGQLANHRQIRSVRRALAQILTEMHEKEEQGPQAEAPAAPEPASPRRRPRAAATAVAEPEPEAEDKPRRAPRRSSKEPAQGCDE